MKKLLFVISILVLAINTYGEQLTPQTKICNFDGENESKIYSLVTMPGVGTTFKLPDGWKIDDFIVTDSVNFHAESNGTIGVVIPRSFDKSTSVNVYTNNGRLFVFHLSSTKTATVDQLVVVDVNDQQIFNQRVKNDAQKIAMEQTQKLETWYTNELDKQVSQTRKQMMFSINNNYRITGNIFAIEGISDDGVFTYVKLARSQERPVVYLGEAGKSKELEVVKYTDEGDYYVIHRVLTPSDKGFVLKLGDKSSEIRRK